MKRAEQQTAKARVTEQHTMHGWGQVIFAHPWPATMSVRVQGCDLVVLIEYDEGETGAARSFVRVCDPQLADVTGRTVLPILSPDGPVAGRVALVSREDLWPTAIRQEAGPASNTDTPEFVEQTVRKANSGYPLSSLEGEPNWMAGGKAKSKGKAGAPIKYPFATMPERSTFRVPVGPKQPKFSTMRVLCSRRGSELGRKFRCHQYDDGTIEVWRES